jgi:UDP-N-acetylmuramoylalanine--D-glutamate ligase
MMNCVVLGAGESGVGAALLAKEKGINVFVSDFSVIQENFAQELIQANIEYEQQKHSLEKIYEADIIVKSPGIPDHIPLIQDAIQKGIEVVSEIEFASRYCQTPIIAITGSNGKTTTTALIHHLFKESGLTSKIGGNYGISFARLLLENDLPDVFVLEISSFQLDGINSFKPKIAIVLNISADHLDRYQYEILNYAKAKMRITANQDSSDTFIYNSNDELTKTLLNENPTDAQLIPVAELIDELNDLDGSPIKNNNKLLKYTHNRFNAQCAIYAACSFGVKPEHIESQLNSFEGEAHRMELVKEINGIEFINDSKATNVDAVLKALQSLEKPVIWIAGGTDKGNEYDELVQLVKPKIKALLCLGVDNTALKNAFQEVIPELRETTKIDEAVQSAFRLADKGDIVLLSPACASFDLFKNYIDRGNQFKDAVAKLN